MTRVPRSRSRWTQSRAAHPALETRWRRGMVRWWLFNLVCWLTVAPLSAWGLRRTWAQLATYFTWAALRYGLIFNRLAAAGLGLCLGLTVALLVAETRHFFFGLTRRERYLLLRTFRRDRTL